MKFSFFLLVISLSVTAHAQMAQNTVVTSKCGCSSTTDTLNAQTRLFYDTWTSGENSEIETFASEETPDFFILNYKTFQIETPEGVFHFKLSAPIGTTDMSIYYAGYKLVLSFDLHNNYAFHTKTRLF